MSTVGLNTNKPQSPWSRTLPLATVSEHKKYNGVLYQRNSFPYTNRHNRGQLFRRTVSFRFRSIEFSKKRALPFFLSIELLTNRKCIASLSNKNVQAWKIRKGRLVGCKVYLRDKALDSFIDTLTLALSRREKFQPSRWSKTQLSGGGFRQFSAKESSIKGKIESSGLALSIGELVLFHPIELGLGLHPDVQRVELNFLFNTFAAEERFFILRSFKIPVIGELY